MALADDLYVSKILVVTDCLATVNHLQDECRSAMEEYEDVSVQTRL